MIKLNLKNAIINNNEDLLFLYEVLKYRWKHHDIINIEYRTSRIIPKFEEHVNILKNNNYYKNYIIKFGDINIGSCYIDNDHVYGVFILPNFLKKALITYKNQHTELSNTKEPISVIVFKKMIKLNPEIKTFYAKVNPKNIKSRRILIDHLEHEEVEIILRKKIVNGKLNGKKWPDAYE